MAFHKLRRGLSHTQLPARAAKGMERARHRRARLGSDRRNRAQTFVSVTSTSVTFDPSPKLEYYTDDLQPPPTTLTFAIIMITGIVSGYPGTRVPGGTRNATVQFFRVRSVRVTYQGSGVLLIVPRY
eukprot:2152277-Rhodomonas_salina.3